MSFHIQERLAFAKLMSGGTIPADGGYNVLD